MQRAPATMTRSPRQAPAGACATPAASATATPLMAIRTPAVLRAVSRSMPSAAATTMVRSGRVESASAPARGGRVRERHVEEDEEHREEQEAERGHGEPVLPRRPAARAGEGDRQEEQEPQAETEGGQRDGVGAADHEAGRRRRHAPEPAREDRGQDAGALGHPVRTICVWMVRERSRPPASVTRVCHTMVRRPGGATWPPRGWCRPARRPGSWSWTRAWWSWRPPAG